MILSKIKQLIGWWFNRHQPQHSAKMSNPKTVEEYIAYHIYIPTPKYKLDKGEVYHTNTINRDFSHCGAEKQKAEELVETVRGYKLPSRQKCLFVCNSQEVRYWYNYICKKRANGMCVAVVCKLKLKGTLFWTYADYFTMEAYWNPDEKPIEKEGLFEGEYEVVDICNIDDFH